MSLASFLFGTPDAVRDPPHGVIGCAWCGLVQRLPARSGPGVIHCRRCDAPLERMSGRGLDAALACAVATLVLLPPAILLPLMRVSLLGTANRSTITAGIAGLWHQGWPLAGIVLAAELIALPLARFGLLAAVLAMLRARRRAAWLGPAFRIAERLDEWATIDVFLIGCIIGYSRVAPFLPVRIGAGGACVIAAAFMTMITRATLERRAIWRSIGPESSHAGHDAIACAACGHVAAAADAGTRCPRCRATLWRQRPHATAQALALTLAGFIFYPIAYLYPMEIDMRAGTAHAHSILSGVMKLFQAGLWPLGLIIFTASVAIPLIKLFGIAWIILSSHRHSTRRLRLKGHVCRLIVEIGRWSHIDVFTVAVFLPLLHLSGLLSIDVADGLPAFLAVVVLTMLAARALDPRRIWIAAREPAHG
ncbi:paraquat-inducible protein A [Acidiphilium cryptum]|uniref:Paraquat-inducible protein A n=3 Tax=Acidiphilium TaxID=522 RepID=A5G0A0_ACICJ|nr:paraquat-inducible protein A [Acidiphilium cryptum]ABQ31282.1 Paraquat-inducible protein A [Acidiphilium cryptum JF-5]